MCVHLMACCLSPDTNVHPFHSFISLNSKKKKRTSKLFLLWFEELFLIITTTSTTPISLWRCYVLLQDLRLLSDSPHIKNFQLDVNTGKVKLIIKVTQRLCTESIIWLTKQPPPKYKIQFKHENQSLKAKVWQKKCWDSIT